MQGNEENLKETLFKFDDIMKELNINYVLVKGTLLGAYRNGCLLPWDEDIDIEIPIGNHDLYTSFNNLDVFKILRIAKEQGFINARWGHEFILDKKFIKDPKIAALPIDKQWETFIKTDPRWKIERAGMTWKGSHSSIGLLKERNNQVHIDCFMCIENIHSCYKPTYDFDNAIKKIKLYDRYFYIRDNVEYYLDIQYGNTWRDICCSTELWFKYGSQISKGEFPLEIVEFNEKWILPKRNI